MRRVQIRFMWSLNARLRIGIVSPGKQARQYLANEYLSAATARCE